MSALPQSLAATPRLDRWLRFEPAATVTVWSGKVEIGQGIETAIAQIAAAALGVAFERVVLVAGHTGITPDEGYTSGSQSVEAGGMAMRAACAEVRARFVREAARRFEVSEDDVRIDDGRIHVPGTDLATSYWSLAPQVDLAAPATGLAATHVPTDGAILGASVPRRDLPAKLTGAAYVHDRALPGMLYGRVLRPPSYGAVLRQFDAAAVRASPGVACVLVDGRFIALAAEREEQAVRALGVARAAAQWDEPDRLPATSEVREFLPRLAGTRSVVARHGAGTQVAGRRIQATYSKPYLAHASIGPSCALAQWDGDRVSVWSHTQGPHPLRGQLARVLAVAEENVTVIHDDGAGCYGHNGADDVALDAALLARAARRPVQVQWTREDELAWSPYGSAMLVRLAAVLDDDGCIAAWEHEIWSHPHNGRPGFGEGVNLLAAWHLANPLAPSAPRDIPLPRGGATRNAVPLYELPAWEVVLNLVHEMPLRVSALRTLGAYANVFAAESFMDELAGLAGTDPVTFRLRHLADLRARAVLERAAARVSCWAATAAADEVVRGRGYGLSRYKNASAYCAVGVEVSVAEDVRVERVVAVVDAGEVINPDGLANQIEGGVMQAISWTLREAVTWDEQRVLARSWETYPILGFDAVPRVEVIVVPQRDAPPLGVGECAAGPTAAAIANAVHAALGLRMRDLPLTPERIVAAMA